MKLWKFAPKIKSDPLFCAAISIVKELQSHHYTAYFVGGVVRDGYLGRKITEIDIVTSAKPSEVCALFPKYKLVGAHFGVVLVSMGKYSFDVATFRTDGIYIDGRHPTSVEFSDEEHDALRRDFTINGIFYDPISENIIDYVGGLEDLQKKNINTIGSPKERFQEDHLRMLRGIRFGAQLSHLHFTIAKEVLEAIKGLAPSLALVSKERIRIEVLKILSYSKDATYIKLLFKTGLAPYIFPPLSFSKKAQNLLNSLLRAKTPFPLLYLSIVWEKIKNWGDIKVLGEKFYFTVQELDMLKEFFLLWNNIENWENMTLWQKKRLLRYKNTGVILSSWEFWFLVYAPKKLEIRTKIVDFYRDEKENLFPPRLISGETLIQMGLKPSPEFKQILESVENQQLEGYIDNEAKATAFLKTLLKKES